MKNFDRFYSVYVATSSSILCAITLTEQRALVSLAAWRTKYANKGSAIRGLYLEEQLVANMLKADGYPSGSVYDLTFENDGTEIVMTPIAKEKTVEFETDKTAELTVFDQFILCIVKQKIFKRMMRHSQVESEINILGKHVTVVLPDFKNELAD